MAHPLALAIGLATLPVFAAFLVVVIKGTPFEPRTIAAMTLRSGFRLAVALFLGPSPTRKGFPGP